MVNYSTALDRTFSALADPTRRAVLERLAAGESTVTALAEPFAVSLPAVSKHLRVLERAGLITRLRDGRLRRCVLTADPLRGAADWIERYRQFWEGRFDALARYLDRTQREERPSWPPKRRRPTRHSGSRGPSGLRGRGSSRPGRTRRR